MRKRAVFFPLCVTAIVAGGLAFGVESASATISNSPGSTHIWNVGSGKCIDVGPPVEQWRCLNTFNEEWQLADQGNGDYQIVSHTNGECLTQEDSSANGTPVDYEPCSSTPAQLWLLTPSGSYPYRGYHQLVNQSFGQCLDLENGDTSDGVPMQVWDCNPNTNNQYWGF